MRMVQVARRGRRIKRAFQMLSTQKYPFNQGEGRTTIHFMGMRNSVFLELLVSIFSYDRPDVMSFAGTNYCRT